MQFSPIYASDQSTWPSPNCLIPNRFANSPHSLHPLFSFYLTDAKDREAKKKKKSATTDLTENARVDYKNMKKSWKTQEQIEQEEVRPASSFGSLWHNARWPLPLDSASPLPPPIFRSTPHLLLHPRLRSRSLPVTESGATGCPNR